MVAVPKVVTVVAGLFTSSIPVLPQQPGAKDLSNVTIPLTPAQRAVLGSPTTPLAAVGLGVGVQNYTCSANNVFVCVLVLCVDKPHRG